MSTDDLPRVLEWRNHPEVRRYMFTQHEISMEEHAAWFTRNESDQGRRLLILECDGVDLGFVNLHRLSEEGVWDWGFYVSPTAPKGTGRRLGQTVLNFAFGEMKIAKLAARVILKNERSIKYHRSLGFEAEAVLHAQRIAGGLFDIMCFGLARAAWHPEINS